MEAIEEALIQPLEEIEEQWNSSGSWDDTYKLLADYLKERRFDVLDQEGLWNGLPSEVYAQSFSILEQLHAQTDSYYTRRLLEWAMNREVHELLVGVPYTVDDEASDPAAYALWEEYSFMDAPPEGIVQKIDFDRSDFSEAFVSENQSLFAYAEELLKNHPNLGDPDAYAPDPYLDLASRETIEAARGSEHELAIETAHLFGVRPADLSDAARMQLFHFGVNLTESDHARVQKVVSELPGSAERGLFAESFLATEFGDDFGDKILSIAEHAMPEQAAKVFELIGEYRVLSHEFGQEYAAFDPELAAATERAMNETLTDMLTMDERVARDGATTVDTAPHQNNLDYVSDGKFNVSIGSVDEAIATMEHLRDTLTVRRSILDDKDALTTRVVDNESEMGYQVYRRSSLQHGDLLIHIREEGAGRFDREFEYGNREGVEATVGYIVNPTGDHRLASNKDPRGVSIRFDREGRMLGEPPNASERTPIRDEGMMSLDVSSVMGDARTVPVRIGRMIAAGNILRAREQGGEVSLHHNTNYFDQDKYGAAKGFAGLANYVRAMAETQIATQRSRKAGQRAVAAIAA